MTNVTLPFKPIDTRLKFPPTLPIKTKEQIREEEKILQILTFPSISKEEIIFYGKVKSWVSKFPTQLDVQKKALESLDKGYSFSINDFPQLANITTNFGGIQLLLDNYTRQIQENDLQGITKMTSVVYRYDKSNKIEAVTSGLCQLLKILGSNLKICEILKSLKNEIINPKPNPNPDPNIKPIPRPGPILDEDNLIMPMDDPEQTARKWFLESVGKDPSLEFLARCDSDSRNGVAKYQAVAPSTPESRYLVKYYETIQKLCKQGKEEWHSKEESSKFWESNRWWVYLGSGFVLFVIFMWRVL